MSGVPQAVIDTLSTDDLPPEDGRRRPVVLQVLARLEAGGAARDSVEIAGAIAAAGGIALVASAGGRMARELDRLGARHVALPLDRRDSFAVRANAGRLAGLIEHHGVDIIHAYGRGPARSARIAARRTGRALITTVDGTFRDASGPGGWLRRHRDSAVAEGDRVIAVSEFAGDQVRARHAADPDRLRVIPRGIDLRRLDPELVRPHRLIALARQWRLPDGVPLIVVPGRLARSNGHGILIDALVRLRDRALLCLLVPTGGDDRRAAEQRAIERLIDGHGLEGRVQIVAPCADMPAAYMSADLVVSPSTRPAAFDRAVAEAQAMGRPIVASDHGAAREQLAGNPMAWLAPPGDPATLAAAIDAALDLTGEARAALAPEAIATVRARFSSDAMCAKTLAVYAELLGSEPRAANGETASCERAP